MVLRGFQFCIFQRLPLKYTGESGRGILVSWGFNIHIFQRLPLKYTGEFGGGFQSHGGLIFIFFMGSPSLITAIIA